MSEEEKKKTIKLILMKNVPYYRETITNTCSEAMVQSLLEVHGVKMTQQEIIEQCGEILKLEKNADAINLEGMDVCLNKIIQVSQCVHCENTSLKSIEELKRKIDENEPVIVRWQWKENEPLKRHSIMPIGYEEQEGKIESIIYNDPSPMLKKGEGMKIKVEDFEKLWIRANREILMCCKKESKL